MFGKKNGGEREKRYDAMREQVANAFSYAEQEGISKERMAEIIREFL